MTAHGQRVSKFMLSKFNGKDVLAVMETARIDRETTLRAVKKLEKDIARYDWYRDWDYPTDDHEIEFEKRKFSGRDLLVITEYFWIGVGATIDAVEALEVERERTDSNC